VEFQPDAPEALYKTYFSLLNELRQTLASPIDLVMADAIRNPYVKASIEASKQEIYAA
jgi:predicted nucleotidyltransferase